jgi:hypothetical protein
LGDKHPHFLRINTLQAQVFHRFKLLITKPTDWITRPISSEELICCKYFALYHQPSESFLDESSELLSVSSFLDELVVPYQASGLPISRQL